ncbi:hypothetical protein NA57DRAFT_51401 [Rhizodiscina lignyota]|uniref:BZIP domain-containing protein n=1 Tax=Rhizodiscina lignyota TaxID=1504668 RepID=A0A9P4IR80_9PEZI|nr:hypothetical protein NA57DRAFT_51401 [Rhizodiscina lignyota]
MAPSGPSEDGSPKPTTGTRAMNESDLARKRARDRKAQQAMRDRNKWSLQTLTQQVAFLTHALENETRQNGALTAKVHTLENENDSLRVQNAALRLNLLGAQPGHEEGRDEEAPNSRPPWQRLPVNTSPTCLSDQILQTFVSSQRRITVANLLNDSGTGQFPPSPSSTTTSPQAAASPSPIIYPHRLNLCPLMDKSLRSDDETSNVVGDIVRSYTEIETLPKQVAVHFLMSTLLHWQLLQDEPSWAQMPVWLRPEPKQLSTPHAAWVDRIPWPRARNYLVDHPEITLDAFAAVYSSSFDITWNYDPSHVVIQSVPEPKEVFINPIYEEHIRQLKHWSIGEAVRKGFPELAKIIDGHPS